MNLYLVRHAEAQPLGGLVTSDLERPLTVEGERNALAMGRVLSRVEPRLPLIASSPLIRAVRTASLLSEGYPDRPALETWDELSPGFRQKDLLARIAGSSGRAMLLVAHQPDLGILLAYLLADAAADISMPPAAIACVALAPATTMNNGRLHWLVTPGLVRALSLGF
jgi:phosphohistidine phosphatase